MGLGADETAGVVQTSKPLSNVPASIKQWVDLIATQGLEYYKVSKQAAVSTAESDSMTQAFDWMVKNGYLVKPGTSTTNYTPYIIGGVALLVLLGVGGVMVKRRRR
jgi:LPXTG-motif cell wall-anchored protein